MDLNLFPAELRALPQWCVATLSPNAEGKEDKRPYDPKTGKPASSVNPDTWGTFEQAIDTARAWQSSNHPRAAVGFMFHTTDDFVVIDLDTYKVTLDMVRGLHAGILSHAETYAEYSQSGLGVHIIGRGYVAQGSNNEANSLEVYSSGRFMICTGKPVDGLAKPIRDIQHDIIDVLYPLLQKGGAHGAVSWRELGDGAEATMDDGEVVEMASSAENGDKFIRLCSGDLSDYGGDHSDADAALIQFLCFYTPDNRQVRRIFMRSELGQRDKAQRADYVPRTIANMRAKLEREQIPPVDGDAIMDRARAAAQTVAAPASAVRAPEPVALPEEPKGKASYDVEPHVITFPPGLVGELAQYVLASATRPVPEIALATAIATMAGIVGRNYNISNTGLNQYILLLAKTGTGKESVQSSVDRLFLEIQKSVAMADRFVGPAHFASGQALVKSFQERPCFMSVLGEFGHRLQAMAHPRANGAEKTLMAALLDLYAKSGWGQMLRPSVYSDKEKNTAMVHAPCLTLLGEAEPEGFFAQLDEATIASGFLPRFMVIEYRGDRPERNPTAWSSPPPELVTKMATLCTSVLEMERNNTCSVVGVDAQASAMLDQFDKLADSEIRGANEVPRQLWNRAHLKALRLSALIAVGVNPFKAEVTPDIAQWAIDMVQADIRALMDRFNIGDIGSGDSKQGADLVAFITKYFEAKTSKAWPAYHRRGCIPGRLLQQTTANRSSFKNHRLGATRALQDTLQAMVDFGLLVQVDKKSAKEWFNTSSAVYALGDNWGVS